MVTIWTTYDLNLNRKEYKVVDMLRNWSETRFTYYYENYSQWLFKKNTHTFYRFVTYVNPEHWLHP